MKFFQSRIFLLIIFCFVLLSCNSPKKSLTPEALEVNAIDVPPGTLKVNDTLYVDRVPVTNLMYNEFLDNLENYWSMKKHERMQFYPRYDLSQDTVFQPWTGNTRLYMEATYENPKELVNKQLKLGEYSKNPRYAYHPVIGISKFQAELFCLWRSDLSNAVYAIRSKSEKKRAKFPYKVNYRLPKQKEMLQIENQLSSRDRIRYYQDDMFSAMASTLTFKELQENGNLMILELKEIGQDGTYLPLFNQPLQYYDRAELKTGFRCVCEVEKK
ncbi:SUMF1/EgtB/PvdO family nonheme iron enzyme [Nonlabens sp. YIK11]|uniref:SUMF1/EgtB/PvdO family nonheme iron enzyme n=1 Tax=Nonlabens sp. YIK11 TaxID=1453349 RepID=UPI0006DC129C|nr:SUMF1/EgtB/PvdO family nonheme iron enzyme [Nonlabens sp. YIK11]